LDSSAMVPNSVASCTPMEGDLICVISGRVQFEKMKLRLNKA
jgi:hypothetical protein